MASLPGHSSKKRLKPSPSASFQALRSLCRSGTRGRRCAPTIHCQNFLKKKTADFLRNQRFYGCGDRTRTCDLRVMRQSQGQIGVISAPFCAFCHRSLGGFSIVSVQPCPFQFHSGSKLGQDRFTGNFQSRNVIYQCIPHRGDVDCTISVDIEIPGVLNDTPRNCFVLCLSFVGKLRY